jgi:hypothetical protein
MAVLLLERAKNNIQQTELLFKSFLYIFDWLYSLLPTVK